MERDHLIALVAFLAGVLLSTSYQLIDRVIGALIMLLSIVYIAIDVFGEAE
jgi:divalent metal cation (Fe/Co/Zn/Cd) transporter